MSLTATIVGLKQYTTNSRGEASTTSEADIGSTFYAGCGYGDKNYVARIAFSLEKPAKSLSLKLTAGQYRGVSTTLNYIILKDPDNAYNNANYTMARDGTVTIDTRNYTPKTFELAHTLSAGTHYLYLWTSAVSTSNCYSQMTNNANGRPTITYEELEGAVGVGSRKGTVIIWDGSAWRTGIPKVWDGSEWRIGG